MEVLVDFITRYSHGIQHPRAAGPYLRLMAVRRATREKADRTLPQYEDMDRYVDETGANPERRAALRLLLPHLDECVGHLSTKAQRAVKLRFFAELTNEHIGQLLGCSKQYVGRLLDKTLVALRRCLERAAMAKNATGRPAP
jgi:RNA polymerase sigma factor (sigma-70 family)